MYKRIGCKMSETGDLTYYGAIPQDKSPSVFCALNLAEAANTNSQLVGFIKVTYYVTYFN